METHQCKLCTRSFVNGKALGGHMRSHLFLLPIPPKHQLSGVVDPTESTSSLKDDKENFEGKDLSYGLRENPKKSYKLVDPHFLEPGSGLCVRDGESETESRTPTRRRSTRTRKIEVVADYSDVEVKKVKLKKLSSAESVTQLEVVSSVSDTSCFEDEDVASCLIMMSRDKWKFNPLSQTREKHQCETCNKVFGSSQALGGHRTSHKKVKNRLEQPDPEEEKSMVEKPRKKSTGKKNAVNTKIHECPVCFRVFGSGQALGGHKRSHFLGSSSTPSTSSSTSPRQFQEVKDENFGFNFIDLNLPPPMESEGYI